MDRKRKHRVVQKKSSKLKVQQKTFRNKHETTQKAAGLLQPTKLKVVMCTHPEPAKPMKH